MPQLSPRALRHYLTSSQAFNEYILYCKLTLLVLPSYLIEVILYLIEAILYLIEAILYLIEVILYLIEVILDLDFLDHDDRSFQTLGWNSEALISEMGVYWMIITANLRSTKCCWNTLTRILSEPKKDFMFISRWASLSMVFNFRWWWYLEAVDTHENLNMHGYSPWRGCSAQNLHGHQWIHSGSILSMQYMCQLDQ